MHIWSGSECETGTTEQQQHPAGKKKNNRFQSKMLAIEFYYYNIFHSHDIELSERKVNSGAY